MSRFVLSGKLSTLQKSCNKTESFCKVEGKEWILIDAEGVILGRLASFIAHRLRGKHSAHYTPNADRGDNVVVINCAKIAVTGKKETDKIYYHHTGYPGGIRERSVKQIRGGKTPCDMVSLAVKRMLSKGPMAYKRLSNLFLYSDGNHKHIAQQPEVIDFKSLNRKNSVSSL